MRISTNQLYNQNVQAIMDNQRKLTDTQEQLSTGKRINRPSDDPVGAAKVIRLTEELDSITQYKRNNDLYRSSLEQQETVLTSINSAMDRARTLLQQANSGIVNDSDREAIGTELKQIRDEVLDLMNARDADGDYIFAGHQSQSEAFSFNPAGGANAVQYEGDSGNNQVKLSDSVTLKSTSNGRDLFANVLGKLDFSVVGSSGATVQSSDINNQDSFDRFFNSNYDGGTPANNDYRITLTGGGQAQLTQISSGNVIDTVDFTSGEPFNVKGMSFTINGSPGDTVDFTLNTPEKKNIAQTLHDAYVALAVDKESGAALQNSIEDAFAGIDNARDNIALERSSIGGRLNVATSVYETNLDLEIAAKAARASIEDTDYAEASAEFAKQETALNAALQTFPRISNLSLFNYIS